MGSFALIRLKAVLGVWACNVLTQCDQIFSEAFVFMKRPMIICGVVAIAISFLSVNLYDNMLRCIVLLLVLSSICFIFIKRLRFYIPMVLILVFVAAFGIKSVDRVNFAASLETEINLSGVIVEVKGYEKSVGYILKTDTVNGKDVTFKRRLISVQGRQFETGDRITVSAELFSDNTSTSDRANGVYRAGYLNEVLSHESDVNFYSVLSNIRKYVLSCLFSRLSVDEAALLCGLTLGDKSYISSSLNENIRRSGISHAVVVSGLHLGIITGAFLALSRKIKLGNRITGILGLVFTFLVCAVTGFTVSAIRASLAYVIVFFGYLFNRRPDSLNSLFTAAAVIILCNPFVVGSVSFQLSLTATFGVLVISPAIASKFSYINGNSKIARFVSFLLPIMVTTVSATVVTIPITIYNFGTLSLVAVATNMLVTHAISGALLCSIVAVSFCGVGGIYNLFLLLAGLLSRFIIFIVNSLGELPFSEIKFEKIAVPTAVSAVLALLLSVYALYKYDEEDISNGGNNRTRIKEEY